MEAPDGSKKPTLATVAAHVGVSRSTVSNAYNRPDQLSEHLREEILQAAADLGYPGPDPAARSLRRGRVGAIGIVQASLPYSVTNPANLMLLDGIAGVCERKGLSLVLIPSTPPADDRVDVLAAAVVDGLIAHCDSLSAERRKLVDDRQLPLVVLDGAASDDDVSVGIDDEGGAELAARHLRSLGHESVAILSPATAEEANTVVGARLRGYAKGLGAKGLGTAPPVIDVGSHVREDGARSARELLSSPDRPTALLAFSDELAAGAIDAAHELGIAVPEQLSVVGFDDTPTALATHPPLTTVRQDHRTKGAIAASMLTGDSTERHVRLPVELIERASTAPVRSRAGSV